MTLFKYITLLNGHTAYEWQVGALYGRLTKPRYWWRVRIEAHWSWCGQRVPERRVTFWRNAFYIGWDKNWRELWDEPGTPQ